MYTTYEAHTKWGLMVYRPGVLNAGSIPLILAIVLLLNSYKNLMSLFRSARLHIKLIEEALHTADPSRVSVRRLAMRGVARAAR